MNPKPQGFLKAAIKLKLEQPNLFANDLFNGNNSFQPVSGGEFSFRCLGKSDKGTECISQGHLGRLLWFVVWSP